MNFFETDAFEERIRAVENRAGRVAWEVVFPLQLLMLIAYMRFPVVTDEHLLWLVLGPFAVSNFVRWRMSKRHGVDPYMLAEERRRLGQTKKLRKLLRKQLLLIVVYGSATAGLIIKWTEWPLPGILAAIVIAVMFMYFSYLSIRTSYVGPAQGPGRLEDGK